MSRNALPGAFSFQSLSGYWWIALPGVVGFVVAMLIAWTRWPEPHMHDDFGNLLIASTLLEGRLTNPTPQAWESLETFHVVMQPTYASKYPIGLGAFLAIGKLILGSFAGGLWMCAGLASAAVAWMIAGVFPKRWACFSGLFTATHPYWQNGWSQEFTNGWLAVVGISCVVGGFFRLHRFARFHHFVRKTHQVPKVRGAILGIGIGAVLVLVSRPFEGGVACLFLGCLFLSMLIQRGALRYFWFWKAAVPGISVLFAGIAFQLAINIAITGDWRKLPYQLHETQYGVAPVLIWQTPKEPSIGHRFPEQARFHYGWSMDAYNRTASWKGYMDMMQTRLWTLRNHWGIFVIAASCLALFLAKPRRLVWGLMAVACVALGIVNGIPWSVPQYVSPLIPIFLFLSCLGVQQGIREFQRSLGGRSF